MLDQILQTLTQMQPKQRAEVNAMLAKQTASMRFVPLPGPQTEAYLSKADVLLYGGAAGGGKSFLLMGLS